MEIRFHRKFIKQLDRLQPHQQAAVEKAISTFCDNPHAPELYNHPLKGALAGHRSISAGFDLRLVFIETGGYVTVTFVRVGTHSQLYGA